MSTAVQTCEIDQPDGSCRRNEGVEESPIGVSSKPVTPSAAIDDYSCSMENAQGHHDDSGHESGEHESNDSSPESPSTPQEERSITPAECVTAAANTGASTSDVTGQFKKNEGGKEKNDDEAQSDLTSDSLTSFYRIKVLVPGGEAVDVQIGETDMVQELYQMLLERDATCHRTCFRLYHAGKPLDHITEMRNIPNIKSRAVLYVVEEPYNTREARIHIRHLREILRSLDKSDAYTGMDCHSLVCFPAIVSPGVGEGGELGASSAATLQKRRGQGGAGGPSGSTQSSTSGGSGGNGGSAGEGAFGDGLLPPSYLLPGAKEELPLSSLIPAFILNDPKQHLKALKSIAFSPFNPPPGPRKLRGDVLYLVAETMEDRRFHLTCCTQGFFVNRTTTLQPQLSEAAAKEAGSNKGHLGKQQQEKFNPEPWPQFSRRGGNTIFHSLFDLLSELSPHFRRTLPQILRARGDKSIHERLPTPIQTYNWLVPTLDYAAQSADQIRADDLTQPHRGGLEDHIPGQLRDWNEELQTTASMPRTSFHERLSRDRARFKVHSDFVAAATRGATQAVEGSLLTINPMDEPNTQMYIWNNIFFSYGFDVKDHYKEVGGDAAAHAATSQDLAAIRAYTALDHPKLHTLGMSVIDYRGYRIAAQGIVPGILEREQEETVLYGSYDSGKTVVSSPIYTELLAPSSNQLRIAPHRVWNGKEEGAGGEYVELLTSFESKGIVGNDGRHYLLDLLKTFPPDVNFLEEAEFLPDACRAHGFPRKFKHKLTTLRQELIDAFVNSRYVALMRIASAIIQNHQGEKNDAEKVAQQEEESKLVSSGALGEKMDTPTKDSTSFSRVGVKPDGSVVILEERTPCAEDTAKQSHHQLVKNDRVQEENNKEKEEMKIGDEDEFSARVMAETRRLIAGGIEDNGNKQGAALDIRFNPDCYSTAVRHAPEEDLPAQKKLLAEMAEFLLTQQIPLFTKDCSHQNIVPVDGCSLVDVLHSRGINLRYLGVVIVAMEAEAIPRLDYTTAIAKVELVCRSARHIYRPYIQAVQTHSLAAAIAHFLNCLLGGGSDGGEDGPQPATAVSDHNGGASAAATSEQQQTAPPSGAGIRKGKKKRRQPAQQAAGHPSAESMAASSACRVQEWSKLTQSALWKAIDDDAESHYGTRIIGAEEGSGGVLQKWTKGAVSRYALLRRFCQLVGIQLVLKNYHLGGNGGATSRAPFTESDVHNVTPVVKHLHPRTPDAHELYLTALSKLQQGYPRIGYELMSQAQQLMASIYGVLHPDLALCQRVMARMAFAMGDPAEALQQQQRALLVTERCNGLDSHQTILDYINVAHFTFANLGISTSLRLFYRARYLLLMSHGGEDHPLMGQIDANIGVVLYAVREYESAIKFLDNALVCYNKYDVSLGLKSALIYHILARTHSCRGDFRTAMQMEREALGIYTRVFGPDHEKSKVSSECLRHLTKQAVSLQRQMNDVSRGGTSSALSGQFNLARLIPVNIQPPALQQIVEFLNSLNNLLFIRIRTTVASEGNDGEEDMLKVVEEAKSQSKERGIEGDTLSTRQPANGIGEETPLELTLD